MPIGGSLWGISAALAQTASSVVSDIDVKVKTRHFFLFVPLL